ncbi:creatininase family protein [Sulfurisphaera javensis]|uniref:Creatininase family protein n=1 Tax=Sulfurisphaera javensis TaxID=2049879 RepID=A0AAT9GPT7_9CREN
MLLIYSTRDEIKGKIPLIPIGSIEQHGPHLPMGTDSIIVEEIAKRVERSMRDKILLFPTIYYTCSLEHGNLPYFGVSYQTLFNYLLDLLEKIKDYFPLAIILNGHGGNESLLDLVRRQVNFTNSNFKVYIFSLVGKGKQYFNVNDLHAGTVESSVIKRINSDLVREEKLKEVNYEVKQGVFETITTSEANPFGIINLDGEIKINEQLGEEFIKRATEELINFINSLNF